ncbi:MAG TPA: zinc-dependent alcohol dehydrogenase family protein [Baekduia sp.]|nr:zinc-dependent alcohol dehydrogenase family protein [Baekduia sp.]
MRAVLISEPGEFGLEELPDPTPRPGEVVVAPDGCGICGTDLHILAGEVPFTHYPIVPGHEFAGEVVAVGKGVDNVRIGDVVAVEPSLFCGRCRPCRTGRENLCENFDSIGVGAQNGACAEFVAVPAHKAFVLPESMPRAWGSLVEPVSCVVHGFDMLDSRLGDHVLIYGAGTIGLILAGIASHLGAGSVSVVDTNEARLGRAGEMGADAVATTPAELDRPEGWDAVIDATGSVAAIEDAIGRTSRGGTVLLFGVAPDKAQARFSPFRVYNEELRIIGSMAIRHSFERALLLMGRGVVNGDLLLTHRFGLADYGDALDTFRSGAGLKLTIVP